MHPLSIPFTQKECLCSHSFQCPPADNHFRLSHQTKENCLACPIKGGRRDNRQYGLGQQMDPFHTLQQLFDITRRFSNIQTLKECLQNGFVVLRVPPTNPSHSTSLPVKFISNQQRPPVALPSQRHLETIHYSPRLKSPPEQTSQLIFIDAQSPLSPRTSSHFPATNPL